MKLPSRAFLSGGIVISGPIVASVVLSVTAESGKAEVSLASEVRAGSVGSVAAQGWRRPVERGTALWGHGGVPGASQRWINVWTP